MRLPPHLHMPQTSDSARARALGSSAAWALAVAALVLGLFWYWFAVADRYQVFLYEHLGQGPFDPATVSRYLMAGCLAGGIVLALSLPPAVAVAVRSGHAPAQGGPFWAWAWGMAAAPVGVGVFLITTTQNSPTLPPMPALAVAAVAWLALAPALAVAQQVAQAPRRALRSHLLAVGLLPMLLLTRAVELPAQGRMSPLAASLVAGGGLLFSALWIGLLSPWLCTDHAHLPLGALLMAAAAQCYLLLPLVHYLFLTPPGFRYITAASNLFASSLVVQAAAIALAIGLAWWAVKRQSSSFSLFSRSST